MIKDPMIELRIQNAKDAHIALFNALGPKHYSTLWAAFELGRTYMEEMDDMSSAIPYLRDSYEGLKNREAEIREQPWKPGVYYALALMAAGESESSFDVSEELINKYPDLADEDVVSYMFLQEFRYTVQRGRNEISALVKTAVETYKTLVNILDTDDPKYMHWLMLTVLSMHAAGDDENAHKILEIEQADNIYEDIPISQIFDITIDIIRDFTFIADEAEMKETLIRHFYRLTSTEEFKALDNEEMSNYFSSLSNLFAPIQNEVNVEYEAE